MSNKKILKDTRGMSLIETIVGATLLGITMFMAYSVFGSIFKAEATTKRSLSLIVARNNLVSHLLDAKTWINSTVATENTVLNCVAQQNQTDPVVRNCSGVTSAPINIYALDNTIAFNLQRTNIGFDWFGQACDTYQTPPSDGNPHCPVGFSVVAIPQCAASLTTCLNPSFVFQAQFAVNAGQATNPMNMAAFNFKIYEAGFYCPIQDLSVALIGDSQITVNATQVMGITKAVQVGHFASVSPLLLPCRHVRLDFGITDFNYDTTRADNSTTICLASEETGVCGFSFVHKLMPDGSYSYDLVSANVLVASKPSWMSLSGNETYELDISNGLVKFCIDSRCLYIFENQLNGPFRLRAYPAWTPSSNSPVINRFSSAIVDL